MPAVAEPNASCSNIVLTLVTLTTLIVSDTSACTDIGRGQFVFYYDIVVNYSLFYTRVNFTQNCDVLRCRLVQIESHAFIC